MPQLYAIRHVVRELDHMTPAAYRAQLGTVIDQLITNFNLALAKMDSGTLGTNNVATMAVQTLAQRSAGR